MIVRAAIVVSSVFLGTGYANAEDEPWFVLGMGNQRCAAYTSFHSDSNDEDRRILELTAYAWASGFFSGLNLLNDEETAMDLSSESIQLEALTARILGRCYEEPQALFVEVLVRIYASLRE